MLAGGVARQACVNTTGGHSMEPADLEGTTLPPAGSPNLLMSLTSTAVQFWRFSVNWTAGTGTLTGPTNVCGSCCIQQGVRWRRLHSTTRHHNQLDSLADRLMYRLSYRNFGDHESLVINHSVTSGSALAFAGMNCGMLPAKLLQSGACAFPTRHFCANDCFPLDGKRRDG